ncbi:MAG: hypothetical protein HN657_05160 [Candidatus Marinimicrobia bacterium]|mgnify:FL=1|jgi:hypothetical protein|nr:hypothetical protein [Candidatus Neomarinimicrobiota bacterium]MBT3495999.1 hypothetical protein [Candidatus Neomarinimicrobiota bacterium]MBT3692545.1 hypothetical protein [Candidatus Neomarinimicrobiota bacterium]MBT3732472.1 hypothetical protein [Candidatus Neomarinimicrobiota bacterium]MBT4144955.1 hypothetical protein [Candidatus Neomarinimicrobiota bacterium]
MKNPELLNELEQKIKDMATALSQSREKIASGVAQEDVSGKLSLIEDHVKNLIQLLNQLEND